MSARRDGGAARGRARRGPRPTRDRQGGRAAAASAAGRHGGRGRRAGHGLLRSPAAQRACWRASPAACSSPTRCASNSAWARTPRWPTHWRRGIDAGASDCSSTCAGPSPLSSGTTRAGAACSRRTSSEGARSSPSMTGRVCASRPRSACCWRCCAAAPIPTSSPSPITSSSTACPMGACSTTASAGSEAATSSACRTPGARSAGTGRRATGRRCRRRGPTSPPSSATSWRRPCRTPCRSTAAAHCCSAAGWTRRSSPRWQPRAPPTFRRSRPRSPSRSSTRRRGRAGWRTTPASHSPPSPSSGASRWMPPRRTCAPGSCRCPHRASSSRRR